MFHHLMGSHLRTFNFCDCYNSEKLNDNFYLIVLCCIQATQETSVSIQ